MISIEGNPVTGTGLSPEKLQRDIRRYKARIGRHVIQISSLKLRQDQLQSEVDRKVNEIEIQVQNYSRWVAEAQDYVGWLELELHKSQAANGQATSDEI